MAKSKFPQGLRKFIRQEKSRIRREVSDTKKQEKTISELYQKLAKPSKTSSTRLSKEKSNAAKRVEAVLSGRKNENARNLQTGDK